MAGNEKRWDLIKQALALSGACSISTLAKQLGVSTMTIRRDLESLTARGTVRVYHGVAVLPREEANAFQDYDLSSAEWLHAEEKTRIARAAAALVEPGDILIVDGGSTAAATAREIPNGIPLTVICLGLNAFLNMVGKPGVEIILAGGLFHERSRTFEGPESIALVKRYRATKAFISASGFREDLGVTCSNHYLLSIKQSALSSSIQKILIADSSKFGKVDSCHFADLSDFDRLITDNGLPESALHSIRARGVQVDVV